MRVENPSSGKWDEVSLGGDLAAMILSGALYSPGMTSVVPLVIEQALQGRYEPLLALGSVNEDVGEMMAQGMFLSVSCNEDYHRHSRQEIEEHAQSTFLGTAAYSARWGPCEFWPRTELPANFYEPVASDKPVLILSGDLDPVTPPSWGDLVAETLPNSRALVAPGVGHGVMNAGCAMRLIDEFLETADASSLDAQCLNSLERPSFFKSKTGPVVLAEGEVDP